MATNDGAHCRICSSGRFNKSQYAHDLSEKVGLYRVLVGDSSIDRLIRPCECRGDFAFAHQICLSDWIETNKHEYCDICRFKYNIHTYDRSCFEWISDTQQVRRIFMVICWSTLVYFNSALGILNYQNRRTSSILGFTVFVSACIWSVSCTLFICIFTFLLIREFIQWKTTNKRVEVSENKSPRLEGGNSGPKDVLKFSGFRPKMISI